MPRYHRPTARRGMSKQERIRRLAGLGFSSHDDAELLGEGLLIVDRFLAWIREQPCAITGYRAGELIRVNGLDWRVRIEADHQQTRGSYGGDLLNVIPLADHEHTRRHILGVGFTLEESALLCAKYTRDYLSTHLDDCRWLASNALDAELVMFCQAVLDGTLTAL